VKTGWFARRRRSPLGAAAAVLAAWTLVGLFRAADRYFSDPFQLHRLEFGVWEALAQSLLSSTIWAAFTPAAVWIARRAMPARRRWAGPVARLALAALALPVAHAAVYQLLYPVLMGFPCVVPVQLASLRTVLPVVLPTQVLTFGGIVGATWLFAYSRLSKERELKASQMKTRLAHARLETLKMQLHPHFLFNTLNSILPLVFRDREAATRTVAGLSDLLRLSLQNEGSDLISLRRELELLSMYLEIQQTRFQDRLTVRLDVEPAVADALVPNLILQPLVENAIKHGIAVKPGSGQIEIQARRSGRDRLVLRVVDDGPGPSGTSARPGADGVGLRNTHDRLELLYPGEHLFELGGTPGDGFEVTLVFPLAHAPAAAPQPATAPRGLVPAGRLAPSS
jgi:two-component system LytT family sensor kinase